MKILVGAEDSGLESLKDLIGVVDPKLVSWKNVYILIK
jgi:hypothetical protein